MPLRRRKKSVIAVFEETKIVRDKGRKNFTFYSNERTTTRIVRRRVDDAEVEFDFLSGKSPTKKTKKIANKKKKSVSATKTKKLSPPKAKKASSSKAKAPVKKSITAVKKPTTKKRKIKK